MTLPLGDVVPDFTAETATAPISFHDRIGDDDGASLFGQTTFFCTHTNDRKRLMRNGRPFVSPRSRCGLPSSF